MPRPLLLKSLVVVVSGLQGAGRRVVARWLASRGGYINGGFLMRVLLYKLLQEKDYLGIDLDDERAVAGYIRDFLRARRIDYSGEPVKVDGVDTAQPDEHGLALRDKVKMAIDRNKVNTQWLHTIASYGAVQATVEKFIKSLAEEIKASGKYNGVVLRTTEPVVYNSFINLMLYAPADIRASRSRVTTQEINETDEFTHREGKTLAALCPHVQRIKTYDEMELEDVLVAK